jgi:integrase
MRVGDIVAVPWSGWDGEMLSWRQSKTGHLVQVRAAIPLRNELNGGRRDGEHILVNGEGQPYTRDGLQTLLWNLVKRLEYLGLVEPGLCFHGLRHSLGAALYDLGLDREARKAALGHVSDAASAVYERDGNRRAASDRAFIALDRHLSAKANLTPRDERLTVDNMATSYRGGTSG